MFVLLSFYFIKKVSFVHCQLYLFLYTIYVMLFILEMLAYKRWTLNNNTTHCQTFLQDVIDSLFFLVIIFKTIFLLYRKKAEIQMTTMVMHGHASKHLHTPTNFLFSSTNTLRCWALNDKSCNKLYCYTVYAFCDTGYVRWKGQRTHQEGKSEKL